MPPIRTVPPYVRSSDWEDEANPTSLYRPPSALVRYSMNLPYVGRQMRARRFSGGTNEQDAIPHSSTSGSQWAEFMIATGAPHPRNLTAEQRHRASAMFAEYDRKREVWEREQREREEVLAKQPRPPKQRRKKVKKQLLDRQFVTLSLRLFELVMSIIALSLGATIFYLFNLHNVIANHPGCRQGPTTYMAVIIGALAIPYTLYITWDEFSSEPIGLRKPTAKLRLLLLDLLFVVLMSANTSLAWEALWALEFPCGGGVNDTCPRSNNGICSRQAALVAVLMMGVTAWVITFCLSCYRLVYALEARRREYR
ncbi:hypothetical protein FKW77_008103 [Venturia effusa]|uniref:Uncharacterized protein n=1 Tax=Venturia effusa TaxID=50376 RepID=A0A517L5U7_9PEZI|nr:hypothetical protein FKW77_008103 [Venturia effusa]